MSDDGIKQCFWGSTTLIDIEIDISLRVEICCHTAIDKYLEGTLKPNRISDSSVNRQCIQSGVIFLTCAVVHWIAFFFARFLACALRECRGSK